MIPHNEISNIKKFHKKKYWNIGLVIFGVIFIYLIVTVFMYITAPRITPYEVRKGSIQKNHAYTGLILRNETVVYSQNQGYVNYYSQDNSKVRVGNNIYVVSSEDLKLDNNIKDEDFDLTEEEKNLLSLKTQTFCEKFAEKSFSDVYPFKSDFESSLHRISDYGKQEQLNELINSGTIPGMTVHSATDDGIIVYSVDGMEGITKDSITPKHLNKSSYTKTEFTNNMEVNADDPVYKLITDEKWSVVIEISNDVYHLLKDNKYVQVHVFKDNQFIWANLEIQKTNEKIYAYLNFDHSVVRYANERYLDIELILENQTGLKIPKSAVTEKDFYVLPKTYLTNGGNTLDEGVLKESKNKNGESIVEFSPVNIYYEEDEYVYLDPNQFENKDVIIKPESNETYILDDTKTLKGVFSINKGYAMFKQIQILSENEDYYIIKEGNSYSLSNYDRIALDSEGIKENDIVF